MRITVIIDDKLMEGAQKATGLTSEKEIIEQALKILVQMNNQKKLLSLRGELKWVGDLDKKRILRGH